MAVTNRSGPQSQRLVYTLETQINESETTAYEVGEQRERNHRYYSMEPLGNEQKGRSHYISPDVLDAVEGKKAVFSETFLSARDVVKFVNCPYPNEAEAKTAYTNKLFKRNQYERLFRDGWHDAFVAKRMVVLAEWLEDTKETTLTLQGTPAPAVQQQLQQLGQVVEVDPSGLETQTMPSVQGPIEVYTGDLRVTLDDSHTELTLIQPERFFRDPNSAYSDQSQWNTIEEDVTRGQLISRGFDKEQIDSLSVDYRFRSEEEDAARKRHDSSWTRRRQNNRIDEQEVVSVYRTWTWLEYDDELFADQELSFEPREGYRLYEIHWASGQVLMWAGEEGEDGQMQPGTSAIAEADEPGIFEWVEMKISHAENGMCTSDVMAHNQKTTSGLKRLILDNQQMVNSSRTLAITGSIKNPRDLLDNAIGATIWAKRADAVTPLPTAQLSPLTMDTLAMMKADGEERSGISGLAKGMNTDAVKYQNADNMIERLTTAGQRRVTSAARDFANTFLVPLSQYIIHLAMKNDMSQDQMEVGGQMVPIAPQQWQDDTLSMEVAVALTPEEGQRMAQQLLTMNAMLTQDPTMALSYGVAQKHALYDMVYDLMGVSDTSKILLAPSDPQFQQQAQQKGQQDQQMQQMQQEDRQLQQGAMKAQVGLAQSADKREWSKFDWSRTDDMADNLLDQDKFEHQVVTDEAELALEKTQDRNVSIN